MTKFKGVIVLVASLAALLMLASCAPAPPAYIGVCPALPKYTATFEKAAGAQLATLPPSSPIAQMIGDYIALRDAVKDCVQ